MADLDEIIKQLDEQRNRIDRAIQVLTGVRSPTIPLKAQTKAVSPALRRKLAKATGHHISAAGRARIAAAARARWAKVKGQRKVVPIGQAGKIGKRTMSPAARRKIAASQRARWAKLKAKRKP
jgi:hypothetical protein